MRDSIFYSTIRAFFVGLFSVIGFSIGIVFLFIVIAALAASSSTTSISDPERTFTPEVVANAEGTRKSFDKTLPVILKVNIAGIVGMDHLTTGSTRKLLLESREGDLKDNLVKAVLLHIDTPGGTVFDADGIYHAIKTYKEQYKVPVYALVDGLCASGGMYIACSADKIYSTDVSLIGSVGVIAPSFLNFSQLIEKVGVQALTLYAGKDKDNLNPLRPWKPGEQEMLQSLMNYFYDHFVNIVAINRPEMNKEKLINEYGAKLFSPQEAKEYGFITENGYNLRKTLKDLLAEIKIEDDKYQVVELQRKTWWSELIKSEFSLLKGQVTHRLLLTPDSDLDPKFMNQFLYLYRP